MKVLLGAFGDPGHAFPQLALGRALVARGHEVLLQTWTKWQAHVEAEGMAFAPAPEYHVFPTRERPLKPYEAVARATRDTVPLVRAFAPDVVVADILTLAPPLAAELEGVPWASFVPHVDPRPGPGFPPYSIGARLPRTALGRRAWSLTDRVVAGGLEQGRVELNETRRRLGLPPLDRVHGGLSPHLVLVGTFPLLEYPLYHVLLRVPHRDKKAMEDALVASGERWTVVRPALLTDGPAVGKVRAGVEDVAGRRVERSEIGYSISREDVGGWVFENLVQESDESWLHKAASITY